MVKLEEVDDEAFTSQPGDEEGDWDTDSDTSASDLSDIDTDESLFQRLSALKDVVPPSSRHKIASKLSTTTEWTWWGVQGVARVAWLVSVSALMLGLPYAVGMAEDQQIAMEEKQMREQERTNEIVAPGATSSQGQQSQQSL